MKRKFVVQNEINYNKLTSSQLDGMFIGIVLGDGCIRKNGDFNFTNTNKDFVDMVENIINQNTNFKTVRQCFKGKYRQGYQENDIYTVDIYSEKAYFKKLRKYLYNDKGKRELSDKTLNKLNLHSLAIWYMSDGSLSLMGRTKGKVYKRIPSLATHAFSKEDNEKMARWFDESLDIKATINKQGKYYYVRFPVVEAQKFFCLIFPYIIPSFYYKIDLAYPENDKRIIQSYSQIYDNITAYRSQEVWDII